MSTTIQDLEALLKTSKEVAIEKQTKLLEQIYLDYQYNHIMKDDRK